MSRFEASFQRANIARMRAFKTSVRISVGPLLSEAFDAIRDPAEGYLSGMEEGVVVDASVRVYQLPVDSVVVDGETIQPKRGYMIIENDEMWEILPRSNGEPAAQLDRLTNDWIVNTKRRRDGD